MDNLLEDHFCHKHEIFALDDLNGNPLLWACEICCEAKLDRWNRNKNLEIKNDDDRAGA